MTPQAIVPLALIALGAILVAVSTLARRTFDLVPDRRIEQPSGPIVGALPCGRVSIEMPSGEVHVLDARSAERFGRDLVRCAEWARRGQSQ